MAENRDTKVTPQEALLELATRKARNNLACFTLYTFPKFKMGWFHREVCRELDEFLADVVGHERDRLLVLKRFIYANEPRCAEDHGQPGLPPVI